MDFQFLLDEPIIAVKKFNSIASDVWEVTTMTKSVIVRTSGVESLEEAPWTWGCNQIFGLDIRKVSNLIDINKRLKEHTNFLIPQVFKIGDTEGKTFAVMEKMPGAPFVLREQSEEFIEQFGKCLAQLHQTRFDYCGNIEKSFSWGMDEFHERMVHVMQAVVGRYFVSNTLIRDALKRIVDQALAMPTPDHGTFILLDMSERQFISDGDDIACVDTEAFAIGPRELDLVAIEYCLDDYTVDAFIRGYNSVLELPTISGCRRVYRYLYRLLEINGPVDFVAWMSWPELFQ